MTSKSRLRGLAEFQFSLTAIAQEITHPPIYYSSTVHMRRLVLPSLVPSVSKLPQSVAAEQKVIPSGEFSLHLHLFVVVVVVLHHIHTLTPELIDWGSVSSAAAREKCRAFGNSSGSIAGWGVVDSATVNKTQCAIDFVRVQIEAP